MVIMKKKPLPSHLKKKKKYKYDGDEDEEDVCCKLLSADKAHRQILAVAGFQQGTTTQVEWSSIGG